MVHKTLVDMDLDYFILEDSWCVRKTRDGCALPQVYDLEDVEYRDNKPRVSKTSLKVISNNQSLGNRKKIAKIK